MVGNECGMSDNVKETVTKKSCPYMCVCAWACAYAKHVRKHFFQQQSPSRNVAYTNTQYTTFANGISKWWEREKMLKIACDDEIICFSFIRIWIIKMRMDVTNATVAIDKHHQRHSLVGTIFFCSC